ncbi:hypothetical protein MAR_025329 [Mya arenaria]|uniref:Uncharacterized protein n=1 Tax=Mya arenaria TaxID=6604 RepID=A0ABY7DWH5_MYAAR|nr:hypothetical protein MAR_025329 [Mya arenaria]
MSIKSGVPRGTLVERRRQPLCEGWVEHRAHTKRGVRYRKLYMLLEQNVICTFERTPPGNQNQLWNLTLDKSTTFKYRGPTKDHSGYKFDLFAGGRNNTFKTVRLSELEQWRGYIIGIVTRTVPVDLDLLEDQIRRIVVNVRGYNSESDSGYIPDRPGPGGGSTRTEVFAHNRSIGSGDSGKGNSLKLDNNGQVVHRFHADKFGEQTPPSWFVTRCSRAMAETVLRAAERLGYGNTLMRESTTHMNNGSYAISKLVRHKRTNDVQFDHYEVIRVAGGYKLNVENEHEPMTCLTEVTHYFQRMFGLDTELLTTNDRRQLQVEAQGEPSYVDRFRQHDHGEPEPDGRWVPSPMPHMQHSLSAPGYVNQEIEREVKDAQTLTGDRCVPSPMPHMQHSLSAPGYVNQENEREVKEARTLPVAPPPPRDPIGEILAVN